MGAEHLNARSRAAVVLGALAIGAVVVACGSGAAAPAGDASRVTLAGRGGKRGAHVQIVRALPMAERVALVERFKARNGAGWAITLGAGGAPDDVDAIRGVVRRARREGNADAEAKENAKENADAEAKADAKENAIAEAVGFLGRNAEFFGMSPSDVPALDVEIGPAKTATYGSWVVHAQGKIPMRGYEGFASVRSAIDVLVYIGDDGATRYFINLSRVHPRLVLDTTPVLGPDDARVMRFVIGREVFVVFDDPRRPNARVRELRRKSLGRIEDKDVRAVRLTIHVSPGPRGAYVSYWLAYAIDVRREGQDFRFIVDADTGDLLEDAVVPVLPASPLDED